MKVKMCLLVAALAGGTALAQTDVAPGQASDASMNPNLSINWTRNVYDTRAIGDYPIYDTGIPVGGVAATGGFAGPGGPGGAQAIADDMTIVNPQGVDLTIDGIKFGMWSSAEPTLLNPNVWLKVEFFPIHTVTLAGTNPSSGTPITTIIDLGTGWDLNNNNGQFFAAFIALTPAEQVTLPAFGNPGGPAVVNKWSVVMSLWADAAGTVPQCYLAPMSRAAYTCLPAGSTDELRWFAAPAVAGSGVCPYFPGATRSGTLAAGGTRGNFMGFRAMREAAVPTANTALGALTLGTNAVVNGSIPAAGGVHWVSFSIPSGAQDVNYRYLDADNEGSAFDGTLFLYSSTGALLIQDASDGSGTGASQISFGMGRRAAVADGVQYDGRDGELAPGDYWLGLSGQGAIAGDGFNVSCPPAVGGNFTITMRNGQSYDTTTSTTLEPSVEPLLVEGEFAGILNPGAPLAAAAMGPFQVRWWKFSTCRATDASNTLVIDTVTADPAIGHSHAVFDATGNRIAFAEGQPAANFVFDGTTVLPAGTYFVSHSWEGGNVFSPDLVANGRWHHRSTAGDNGFTDGGAINVSWFSCSTCGSADFDGDGDTGTDFDIEAFFACLGGSCCGTCGSADFDGDGDTGTDFDIEAFFRVLGGGTC